MRKVRHRKWYTVQLNPINDLHTLPLMSQAKIVRNGLQSNTIHQHQHE